MSKPNGKWSYDFGWTQPYVNMEGFNLFDNQYIREQAQKNLKEEQTEKELALLDSIDEDVRNMLTFPEAEAIINKIKKET